MMCDDAYLEYDEPDACSFMGVDFEKEAKRAKWRAQKSCTAPFGVSKQ